MLFKEMRKRAGDMNEKYTKKIKLNRLSINLGASPENFH